MISLEIPHLDSFLDMLIAERAAAKHTVAAYKRDLTHAAEFFGKRRSKINTADGAAVNDYMGSLGGLAAASRARRLSALRQYYRFLVSEKIRADDPTAGLESPKLPKNLPGVMSAAE